MNSTSATLPDLLMPSILSNSRRAIGIVGPLSGRGLEINGRTISIPSGVSATSQQGGGSTPGGHFSSVPMVHPRRWSTIESGELKSLLETVPVLSQNNCGVLNASEAEIKSAARRRERKSRGEQPTSNNARHDKTASSEIFAVRMKVDEGAFILPRYRHG